MAYQDQTLKCRDCSNDFVWTASEQEFYAQKGFQNSPQRCPACRQAKKQETRQSYQATCADCGQACTVPFQPRGDRPVYCNACYPKHSNKR